MNNGRDLDKPIAIHHTPRSFSERWIEYCDEHEINYRIVDCFSTDIIDQLRGYCALLWHWGLRQPQSFLIARSIIASAEAMGLIVYPSLSTAWHYDDKIAQKYLLEAIGAPLVKSYLFFDRDKARNWLEEADFPLVFKLRNGSASANVRLVKNRHEAIRLCKTAFTKGFRSVPGYFYDTRKKVGNIGDFRSFSNKLKRLPGALLHLRKTRNLLPREKGYVYFQEFIPDNEYDIRITVIGNRAFAYTREVRPHDFRASGSGLNCYNQGMIPERALKVAFSISTKIDAQSLACDFVTSSEDRVLLTEISYGFPRKHILDSPGYWDRNLDWHEGHMAAEDAIIIDLLEELQQKTTNNPK